MNNYIVQDEGALYYECGYSCDNGLFLKLDGKKFFITDKRYSIEARSFFKDIEVVEIKNSLIDEAATLLKKTAVDKIIFDPYDFSYGDFSKLKELNLEFISKPHYSKQKRIIKRKDEIALLKKAAKFGADAFDEFAAFIKNGNSFSEEELFFNAEIILKQRGALGLSFSPIVAINENAAKAHALPTKKSLKFGDLLLFDAGVKYKRYCSDRTRTAFCDENLNFSKEQKFKSAKKQEIYEIVKEAQIAAIKSIKPGVLALDVDRVAREFIKKAGYEKEFFHSTGHGVGIDIHEFPFISPSSKTILKEGMVFSVEPGIYLEGEFGVRIEDVVVVTKEGCEVFS
ncbi:aminopeptidase P family protein [uncultured Campylobacter sp.]|uniref:aminopeptidase P family protein n=1 Tax=uncultured Campylobacter sp. TaxID=218934 RepID=UPI002632D908|nr:aminopeptidase P family protein [uncultured Campylobacter sp.]